MYFNPGKFLFFSAVNNFALILAVEQFALYDYNSCIFFKTLIVVRVTRCFNHLIWIVGKNVRSLYGFGKCPMDYCSILYPYDAGDFPIPEFHQIPFPRTDFSFKFAHQIDWFNIPIGFVCSALHGFCSFLFTVHCSHKFIQFQLKFTYHPLS